MFVILLIESVDDNKNKLQDFDVLVAILSNFK